MKRNLLKIYLIALLITGLTYGLQAQEPGGPPPPPPDPSYGGGNGPVGGGAPVGEGLLILLFAAGGYGLAKWRQSRNIEA